MTTLTVTVTDSDASSADLVNAIGRKDAGAGMRAIYNQLNAITAGARQGRVRIQYGSVDRTFAKGPATGTSATLTLTVPETDAQLAGKLTQPPGAGNGGLIELLNYWQTINVGAARATVAVNVASGAFTATYDKGNGAAAAAATLATIDGGPTLWFEPSGITDASGVAASWDSIGSNTLRFENADTAERPTLITVGNLTVPQFDGSNDVLFSASPFTIVEDYTFSALFRLDTFVNNRRIFDTGDAVGGYLALFTSSGQKLRYEQGASDIVSATAISEGSWYSVIVHIVNSGTSTLYLNGASDGTLAGTALEPGAATAAMAAVASNGANSGGITLADLAIWNDVGTPSVADIYTYHQAIATDLGVSLG